MKKRVESANGLLSDLREQPSAAASSQVLRWIFFPKPRTNLPCHTLVREREYHTIWFPLALPLALFFFFFLCSIEYGRDIIGGQNTIQSQCYLRGTNYCVNGISRHPDPSSPSPAIHTGSFLPSPLHLLAHCPFSRHHALLTTRWLSLFSSPLPR